jgi:hypothetical protein
MWQLRTAHFHGLACLCVVLQAVQIGALLTVKQWYSCICVTRELWLPAAAVGLDEQSVAANTAVDGAILHVVRCS